MPPRGSIGRSGKSGESGGYAGAMAGFLSWSGPANSPLFFGACSKDEKSAFCKFAQGIAAIQLMLYVVLVLGAIYFVFEFFRQGGMKKLSKWAKNIK